MNCPNCGAPKRGYECRYCGTSFARYQGDVVIEQTRDFVDVFTADGHVYKFPTGYTTNIYINDRTVS